MSAYATIHGLIKKTRVERAVRDAVYGYRGKHDRNPRWKPVAK